jgi:hypothetical protein
VSAAVLDDNFSGDEVTFPVESNKAWNSLLALVIKTSQFILYNPTSVDSSIIPVSDEFESDTNRVDGYYDDDEVGVYTMFEDEYEDDHGIIFTSQDDVAYYYDFQLSSNENIVVGGEIIQAEDFSLVE